MNDALWQHPLMDGVHRFDAAVESAVQRFRRRPWVDRTMYALSEAGNHSLIWHTVNAVDALTTHDPVRRRAALRRSVVQGVEQALVNGPIKMAFRRQRPGHIDDHPHDLRVPVTSSFPSGHATAGFCAATLLTADLGRAPLWYCLASVIGWSRVHVGVHHPSDVAVGAIIGATTATVAGRLWASPVRQ
jgi:undecaprenyl-diphosphatase